MLQPHITKEELESLPVAGFGGNVVVVNDETQAAAACEALRTSGQLVGFDTETRPAFQKGVTYKVALVQLSAGKTCFLFRLNKMNGLVEPLKSLLEDQNVIKVGLSTHDDIMNLRKWDASFQPQGFIELQQLVRRFGIEDMSLAKIYALLFHKKISKRQRLTNWEAETLTDKQLAYAALDAVACVEIYGELLKLGRQIINV